MNLPKKVKLVEVSPRDGLQNEPRFVPTEVKAKFIDLLSDTGLPSIEVTSFVSEKKIPQLADNSQLLSNIKKRSQVEYPVLVPNIEGFNHALAAGANSVAIFGSASETFSIKNINCTIAESLERFVKVLEAAKQHNISVRAYISCVITCPYEGAISPSKVATLAKQLEEMGCDEISLGDTIGATTPNQAIRLINTVANQVSIEKLAAHFHDTYGQALTNLYAVLQQGIATIDSSVAGLGGCPYAKGSSGNVATEDVLYMLNGLGIETGVDLNLLVKAGQFICDFLEKNTQSRVALALES